MKLFFWLCSLHGTCSFFFLILSKPQLILSNSKSRSTGQTQLIIRDVQECIKFDFFGKIGHTKSVGFRFYSGIWRSESRISSRYVEITSISLIYSLTYSSKKELLFRLPGAWTDSPVRPFISEETLSWEISRLRHCDQRSMPWKNSYEITHQYRDKIGLARSWLFGLYRLFHEMRPELLRDILRSLWVQSFIYSRNKWRILHGRAETRNFCSSVVKHITSERSFGTVLTVLWWI